ELYEDIILVNFWTGNTVNFWLYTSVINSIMEMKISLLWMMKSIRLLTGENEQICSLYTFSPAFIFRQHAEFFTLQKQLIGCKVCRKTYTDVTNSLLPINETYHSLR